MIVVKRFEKMFDIVGEIAAFITIALIAILFLNAKLVFITGEKLALLEKIREYLILGTLIVVGLEFSSKRGIIVFSIYIALAAVAVIFSFPALF